MSEFLSAEAADLTVRVTMAVVENRRELNVETVDRFMSTVQMFRMLNGALDEMLSRREEIEYPGEMNRIILDLISDSIVKEQSVSKALTLHMEGIAK